MAFSRPIMEKMLNMNFTLPRDLGGGLTLRWGKAEDAEALAAFNIALHTDDPAEPELWLGEWTRELMNGRHPTTNAGDFTIVENEAGEIVSSMNVIHQTWSYGGIEFGVGRPELVGTLDAYRRRGLVRSQFEAIHGLSATRGELVQAITGIPWYYRQFGYEMTLELGGGRPFHWHHPGNTVPVDKEIYQMREATAADVAVLSHLYDAFQAEGLVACVRDAAQWQYEMLERHRDTPYALDVQVITAEGEMVGYVEYKQWGTAFHVRELALLPGYSLRAAALFVTRWLKERANELNEVREQPITRTVFSFGSQAPVYKALGTQLGDDRPPYAWFIRVSDIPAFLQHISPVLEERLAKSVLAGHTGRLRLNFYKSQVQLRFEKGRVTDVSPYNPASFDAPDDGDLFFPDHTFLHVLFGHRSYEEIQYMRVDCFANNAEAPVLLAVLFPKRPSWIRALG